MGDAPLNSDGTYDLGTYEWIVVIGAFCAFGASYGIGANDVANAFATSIGAKSLSLKQAVILAGIFEFFGAFLLGSHVTGTIRGSIADLDCFESKPATLMYGMQCTIFVVGFWLVLASKFELPVSTTHSTVGGIVGFALVSGGSDCVVWYKEDDEFPYMKGISAIVLSWLLSPVLSGICAVILFGLIRTFVLRSSEPFSRVFYVYPVIVSFTFIINIFFIIYKGAKGLNLDDTPLEIAVAYSFSIGGGLGIISCFLLKFLRARVEKEFENGDTVWNIEGAEKESDAKAFVKDDAEKGGVELIAPEVETKKKGMLERDCHTSMKTDSRVFDMHVHAEKFDSKAERVFSYLQVFTACFDSFGHGANDVANAVAPFATIYMVYTSGKVEKELELGDNGYWILAMGGLGIVIGLATYGYHIIESIGVKLCRITPSRGFAIELGAAIVIIIGSRYGIPLSTTHCQVGATTGVGMLEGGEGVNWMLLLRIVAGWLLTLVVVGSCTALIFAQGLYAPCQI
mmetsp:Transcript_14849/g.22095  ORF Transcript_14849/g.22095 Transcript_14849/m.22095 type:complete len:513 (-) Transcript_14849:100-1638(-)